MRKIFIVVCICIVIAECVIGYFQPALLWNLWIVAPLLFIGIYDLLQPRHAILRNFPLIGHFRYMAEFIAPEIRQYFVELNNEGSPFTRLQRTYVYKRAKLDQETHPFGTEKNVYKPGFYWLAHSMYPNNIMAEVPRVRIGGKNCTQPYEASLFNISAMSFGSLGKNAVSALNRGAKLGNFFQNTGEGGVSKYHLAHGGDLVFQIGTAYFGCRDDEGFFSENYFREIAVLRQVKMIELKLSQGAKPGLGGVLPATKNTAEIAQIRKLIPHRMVHSPPAHHTFSDGKGLLQFLDRLRNLSGGKPIGFKVCIGSRAEFISICEAMITTGLLPDFITVDGGEGGTGAAPIEFSDNVGMPLHEALIFVCDTLTGYNLKKDIRVIASGKVVTGFDIIKHIAIGADCCNSARGMMFAIGCIQAMKCDTNDCPTGVATHKPQLQAGLDIMEKGMRAANYHKETVKSALAMLAAAGLSEINEINRSYIYKRVDERNIRTLEEIYPTAETGNLLRKADAGSGEPGRTEETTKIKNVRQNVQKKQGDYPESSQGDREKAERENL